MPVWPPFICHTWYYTAQDDDLEQWELQPRFRLPRHYRQLEVPSLVQRRDWYYLFVSSQDRPQETDNAAKCEWPRSPSIIVATHTTTPLPSISQCPKTPIAGAEARLQDGDNYWAFDDQAVCNDKGDGQEDVGEGFR